MTVIADRPDTRMIPELLSQAEDGQAVVIRLDDRDAAVIMSPTQYEKLRRIAVADEFRQLSERFGREAQANGLTQEVLDEILFAPKGDRDFDVICERLSEQAKANGLTEEKLAELLAESDAEDRV